MAAKHSSGPTTNPTPRAKLTDHEVDLIQAQIEGGMSLRAVAKKFEEELAPRSFVERLKMCERPGDGAFIGN